MRALTLSSLLVFLGTGFALAATDEGLNPLQPDSQLDAYPVVSPPWRLQHALIEM